MATYFRYEIIITANGKETLSNNDVKEKEKCREKSMKRAETIVALTVRFSIVETFLCRSCHGSDVV